MPVALGTAAKFQNFAQQSAKWRNPKKLTIKDVEMSRHEFHSRSASLHERRRTLRAMPQTKPQAFLGPSKYLALLEASRRDIL
jgi:hypothetical protein